MRDSAIMRLRLHRPGVDDDRVIPHVEQFEIEYIQRVDGANAFQQGGFAVAVQRLQGKAAGVDFPAFGHKLRQLIGVVLMAWESFGAEGGNPRCTPSITPGRTAGWRWRNLCAADGWPAAY